MIALRTTTYSAFLLCFLVDLAGCSSKEQSYSQAMQQVCGGPPVPAWFSALALPDRQAAISRLTSEQSEWFAVNVKHTKARELIATLALFESYHWPRKISEAAKEAGVEECPYAQSLGPILPAEVTVISSQYLAGIGSEQIATITKDSISIDGQTMVQVSKGRVAPSEIEGGAQGIKILRLSEYRLRAPQPQEGKGQTFVVGGEASLAINIAADPETPYLLVFQTIASLRSAAPGYRQFPLIVASKNGALGSLPLALDRGQMEFPTIAPSGEPPKQQPVQLIVSLTEKGLHLWSVSGQEGTLAAPALSLELDQTKPDEYNLAALSTALVEITERRWPNGHRLPDDYSLIVQANGDAPFRIVAEILSATQTTPSGEALFSTILGMPFD